MNKKLFQECDITSLIAFIFIRPHQIFFHNNLCILYFYVYHIPILTCYLIKLPNAVFKYLINPCPWIGICKYTYWDFSFLRIGHCPLLLQECISNTAPKHRLLYTSLIVCHYICLFKNITFVVENMEWRNIESMN